RRGIRRHPAHAGAHRRRHPHLAAHPLRAHARLESRVLARGGGFQRDRGAHLAPRRGARGRRAAGAAAHPRHHDRRHRRHGDRDRRAHRVRRTPLRAVRPHRARAAAAGEPRAARAGGGAVNRDARRGILREIGVHLPFLAWLVVLWMLLWNQFAPLALVTGLAVAVFVTRVFRLPTVELSGRINVWFAAVLVVQFLFAVLRGALSVTRQVFDFRRQPGAAIIAVPLRYADDLVMTHVSVVSSLIPGSLVVEADRDRRILYLHVIGVRTVDDVDAFRDGVLRWERRIVRALGDPAQYRALRADEARDAAARRGSRGGVS